MKNRFLMFSIASLFFLLFNAMYCEGDLDEVEKLTSIEVDNIDNSGKEMILARESIKKEALVLGVKHFSRVSWRNDEWSEPRFTRTNHNFINSVELVQVFANTDFNSDNPQGKDITHLFTRYLPETNNEISDTDILRNYSFFLVLKEIPNPGMHSFKLVYELNEKSEEAIEYITEPILLN